MNGHEAEIDAPMHRPEVATARVWAWAFLLSWRAVLGLAVLALVVIGVTR